MTAPRLWTWEFFALCMAAFLFFTSHHSIYTSLALYFHKEQLTQFIEMQGIVIATFTVASIICRPLAGALCDGLWGGWRPSWVAGLSGSAFALAAASYTLCSSSLTTMIVVRIAHGAAMGFFYTVLTATLAKLLPPSRKAEGMSHFGNAIKFAMFAGPPLGLALLDGDVGKTWFFAVPATLGLLAVPCAVVGSRKLEAPNASRKGSGGWKLFNKSALTPGLTMGANSVAFGCLTPFIPLIVTEQGLTDGAKWYYIVYGASLILSRGVLGRLADRYHKAATVVPGMLMVAASLFVIAYAHSLGLFLLGSAIYGLAAGVVQPSLMALAAELSEPSEIGRSMATFSMLNDVGIAIGSLLTGFLAVRLSIASCLGIIAAFVVAGAGFFIVAVWKEAVRHRLVNQRDRADAPPATPGAQSTLAVAGQR